MRSYQSTAPDERNILAIFRVRSCSTIMYGSMRRNYFDDDDDELMPFSVKQESSSRKKKKRNKKEDSWLGEFGGYDEDEDEDENLNDDDLVLKKVFGSAGVFSNDSSFAGASDGLFVSGGGLENQLEKEKKIENLKKEREENKVKKSKEQSEKKPKFKDQNTTKTFGIGASLLQKMGWKGDHGLGKNESGITETLDVRVRPLNKGLGTIEEKTEKQRRIEKQRRGELDESSDSGGEEMEAKNKKKEKVIDRRNQWKKIKIGKEKVQYKTASDLLEEEGVGGEEEARNVTIIDMTGPTERVITSTKQLYDKERAQEDYTGGIGRELRYNMDKLVDMAEVEVKQKSRKVKSLEQKASTFGNQTETLKKSAIDSEAMLTKLQEAQTMIDRLVNVSEDVASVAMASDEETLKLVNNLSSAFEKARKRFGDRLWTALGFPDLLFSLLVNVLKAYYQRSRYKEHSTQVALTLRPLFEHYMTPRSEADDEDVDYWTVLLEDVVCPPLQKWISDAWDCKLHPILGVEIVSHWAAIWSDEMNHQVLHEFVWRKLQRSVDLWNPMQDSIPLHEWIHPWLLLLSERMEKEMFPTIISKLSNTLRDWDPLDPTAYALLRPWRDAFTPSQLDQLSHSRILPKLSVLASRYKPSFFQADDNLEALLLWSEWIPSSSFVKLLARAVFPKIYRFAFDWAMQRGEEQNRCTGRKAIEWYKWVKSCFPQELFSEAKVQILFAHLLDVLLNVLVDGNTEFEPEILPVDLWYNERSDLERKQQQQKSSKRDATTTLISFKNMVEHFAAENNIVFLPISSRSYNGKPLYSFGGITVYFDNQLVYYEESPLRFKPVSLEHLKDLQAVVQRPTNRKDHID